MTSAFDLASFAALLADRTRAAMCLALLDGRAWTAGELATHTGVAPSTATGHLHRLVAGGLLVELHQGRHRYVRLAGPSVAQFIEDMAAGFGARVVAVSGAQHDEAPAVSGAQGRRAVTTNDGRGLRPATVNDRPRLQPMTAMDRPGLRAVTANEALRRGRTCYDHLAGRLGVTVTDAMTHRGLLDQTGGFALTVEGRAWLVDDLRLEADALRPGRRPLARGCLDWTERRPHLAGVAGALLCRTFLDNGWVTRVGSGRAVRVTASGETALRDLLGVTGIW